MSHEVLATLRRVDEPAQPPSPAKQPANLHVLGLSHRSAPVAIRERVVFGPEQRSPALQELAGLDPIHEAAILSTCNRTEIYYRAPEPATHQVIDWFHRNHALERDALVPYLYHHTQDAAIRHVLRVAAGLDSMVLGEPQILGQLKEAYHSGLRHGSLNHIMGRLFEHAFAVAKNVRTDTAIGASPVSVAFAAVSLAKQIFAELKEQTALLIGAGETIELTARHLRSQHIGRVLVANRSLDRARALAERHDGEAIDLADIGAHLSRADVVIASTGSSLPVLGKGTVERALKRRKHRPMFMVDIAVPRDIEPEVARLRDVYLYTVDDLQDVIDQGRRSRQEAADQAEEIIESKVDEFLAWLHSLDAVGTIRLMRRAGESARDEALSRAKRRLQQGRDPEEVLEFLAYTLTNKLLHTPTVQLRRGCREGQDELLDSARFLFNIDAEDENA